MPLVYDAILPHVPVFALVLARIGGMFIFAPALGSPAIPVQVKAMLVIAMSLAVYPTIDLHAEVPMTLDLASLAPAMAVESLIGLSIGMIASLPLVSVQMGGLLMGQQMGLGLGSIYNPAIDSEADVAGQVLFYLALGIFLMSGGLEAMHRAMVATFAAVPIGGFGADDVPLDLVAGMLASGFELAVRIAAPVLCIIFVETVATGLIMKTAPQINILSFGFPIRILLGLAALYASLAAVHEVISEDVEGSIRAMLEWAVAPGRAA
ncbi:MAG: flagellar biosynthetic protein FliR [Phycisphaerales bacterium]|nr:flagellar biosynthetic protein FliR [Phycisphaerales bacterium]